MNKIITTLFFALAASSLCAQGVVIGYLGWPYITEASVTAGTDVTFSVEGTGWTWYHAGTNLATSDSLTITNVQPSDAGKYSATDEMGYTNDFRLYVNSKLRLEMLPIASFSASSPTHVQALLIGQAGSSATWYTIEYSTDLKTWRTMLDFIAPVEGAFSMSSYGNERYQGWYSLGFGVTFVYFPYYGGHCYYRAAANY